jgi:hypothetical protein
MINFLKLFLFVQVKSCPFIAGGESDGVLGDLSYRLFLKLTLLLYFLSKEKFKRKYCFLTSVTLMFLGTG